MPNIVAARSLKNRYARLKGALIALQEPKAWTLRLAADRQAWEDDADERAAKIRAYQEELDELERTIPRLDPEWGPDQIRPIRPMTRRRELGHGELVRGAYGVLRDAREPLTTREIVQMVALKFGLDRSTTRQRENMRNIVHMALSRLCDVVAHDNGEPRRWWVIGGLADPDR